MRRHIFQLREASLRIKLQHGKGQNKNKKIKRPGTCTMCPKPGHIWDSQFLNLRTPSIVQAGLGGVCFSTQLTAISLTGWVKAWRYFQL